ncbi:putative FBD domain, leucine-rich repeat domain superfamily [Arabidopsis thaliana]|uniref:FBD domain-containing protein n=2 Tax=Arabidopsis TaxID=3701 RepID=A0A178V715_ARATH|nr:FBD domain [Arabidopsis thaliana x Arabidopsis arenosa]OAP02050.1 hypothetical protein AXX17_AT3G53750 [Arabidopsis thaliana]
MNLDFDDSKRMHYGVTKQERVKMLQRFIKRVDGKLALCKNVPLNRFSIKCKDDVGPAPVIGWITNVLKRRVSELALDISSCWDWPMSTAIDGCNTMVQEFWESCSVSSTSLKRLTYLKANFDSLVEARLDLQMTHDQIHKAKFSADDPIQHEGLVGNATVFFIAICNVRSLYLSYNTLEPLPVFNNLIQLTVKTDRLVGWESLTALLKNSPNLETLVFEGLLHRYDMKCQSSDECLCKPWEEENIPTCLSLSPVKVLKIMKFGDIDEDEDMDKMMDQVEYFLETMPNLEQLIIHYEISIDEDVEEVLSQFQMVPREGLTECRIQVISDNLVLSSI